jgi:hypothetical protein
MICPTGKMENFLREGWTGFGDLPVGLFCRSGCTTIVLAREAKQFAGRKAQISDREIDLTAIFLDGELPSFCQLTLRTIGACCPTKPTRNDLGDRFGVNGTRLNCRKTTKYFTKV